MSKFTPTTLFLVIPWMQQLFWKQIMHSAAKVTETMYSYSHMLEREVVTVDSTKWYIKGLIDDNVYRLDLIS